MPSGKRFPRSSRSDPHQQAFWGPNFVKRQNVVHEDEFFGLPKVPRLSELGKYPDYSVRTSYIPYAFKIWLREHHRSLFLEIFNPGQGGSASGTRFCHTHDDIYFIKNKVNKGRFRPPNGCDPMHYRMPDECVKKWTLLAKKLGITYSGDREYNIPEENLLEKWATNPQTGGPRRNLTLKQRGCSIRRKRISIDMGPIPYCVRTYNHYQRYKLGFSSEKFLCIKHYKVRTPIPDIVDEAIYKMYNRPVVYEPKFVEIPFKEGIKAPVVPPLVKQIFKRSKPTGKTLVKVRKESKPSMWDSTIPVISPDEWSIDGLAVTQGFAVFPMEEKEARRKRPPDM